jgi:hypothetical protein
VGVGDYPSWTKKFGGAESKFGFSLSLFGGEKVLVRLKNIATKPYLLKHA